MSSSRSSAPSRDHTGTEKKAFDGNVIAFGCVAPVCSPIINWYSPLASESHAMRVPSGDHTGLRSCTPLLCVRLRAVPFSAGTVKMSPRASKAARTPVGDSTALRTMLATLLNCGRAQGKSPVTSMVSRPAFRVAVSTMWM